MDDLYLLGSDIIGAQQIRRPAPKAKPGPVKAITPKAASAFSQVDPRKLQDAKAKAQAAGRRALAAAERARSVAKRAPADKAKRLLQKAAVAEAAGRRALSARVTVLGADDRVFKLPQGVSIAALRQMLAEALALANDANKAANDANSESGAGAGGGGGGSSDSGGGDSGSGDSGGGDAGGGGGGEEAPPEPESEPAPPPSPEPMSDPLAMPKNAKVRSLQVPSAPEAPGGFNYKPFAIAAGVIIVGLFAYRSFGKR